MKTSTAVKILLTLFLGAFVWFVILSIRPPERRAEAPPAPELRRDLLSRMEDVTLEIGDIAISAAVQENYKNGELHFLDFTMVRETQERTLTVTGRLAQTRFEGSEVAFMEIEGDVRVVSSDGLDLRSRTLNYVAAQRRIFTQTPASFAVRNLSGRADSFVFGTDSQRLALRGNVQATFFPDPEEAAQPPPEGEHAGPAQADEEVGTGTYEEQPTAIECHRLVFDQQEHRLTLEVGVRIEQPGSFLRAGRIESELTEDNRQFASLVAHGVRARARAEEEEGDGEAESEGEGGEGGEQVGLVDRASGIKDLRCETLTLRFATGRANLLLSLVAEGEAVLEPMTILAGEIDAELDLETNDFTEVLMSRDLELRRDETRVSGNTGRLDVAADQLQVDGDPVLTDGGKRVEAEHMLVDLAIGDLAAEGDVRSTFYPGEEGEGGEQSYIFAFGNEGEGGEEETSIAAGSLRLDYRNNVLRYGDGVRLLQGESTIQSDSLDIFQQESRFIATGAVSAALLLPSGGEEAAGGAREPGEARVALSADLLEFDKRHNLLRLAQNVEAQEGEMLISCQHLRYDLGGEDRPRRAFARGEVVVTIGAKMIYGDVAEYYVPERLLVVQGSNVRLEESGRLEANHNKLTFDIANDTLRFDARADQLLRTRISIN